MQYDLTVCIMLMPKCREQEVTRLVRVDVSTSANGVLAVALSEQEKGFAPYRLDNCTALKLHLRYLPPPHSLPPPTLHECMVVAGRDCQNDDQDTRQEQDCLCRSSCPLAIRASKQLVLHLSQCLSFAYNLSDRSSPGPCS